MKNFKQSSIILFMAALTVVGCNKKEPAQQVKQNGLPKATASTTPNTTIAVVDIDTLAAQSEYCKEGLRQLEAKQAAYRKQLNAKGQALQNAMINFQKKAQAGQFTSQQQAEQEQTKLQKQQQSLQTYQAKIEADMAKATQDYQTKLRADIDAFLKSYNSDGRFKVIISKSGDNVLYVDPTVDITADVISGLNQLYKEKK